MTNPTIKREGKGRWAELFPLTKKKSLSNGYKQNWGIISLLLGKKWSHEQKKGLPNGNYMQFTFIYFIFIVTENTTFGFATYFEIYTSQRLGYTNNKITNKAPDLIGLTHQSTNLISLFNTKNSRKVTKLKPNSWNILSQNNMPYCCYYTIWKCNMY